MRGIEDERLAQTREGAAPVVSGDHGSLGTTLDEAAVSRLAMRSAAPWGSRDRRHLLLGDTECDARLERSRIHPTMYVGRNAW
jgi:hypothetical protein